jgi:tetratricopeptide (TPR) repeat protein
MIRSLLTILFITAWFLGCTLPAGWRVSPRSTQPIRISEVVEDAVDAARRASLRLVIEGLDADAVGDRARAQARYERALQVDATNPYAYIAIARHYAEGTQPRRAIYFLDRADALLKMEGRDSPRVEVHLLGLRGSALYAMGQVDEGSEYLAQAQRRAPDVWGDGMLSPEELR